MKNKNNIISIHSLHTEGDPDCTKQSGSRNPFQSTPSTRRETFWSLWEVLRKKFQSTPSTRRETRPQMQQLLQDVDFNPLPPHGGRRQHICRAFRDAKNFNPLPPHGGRHCGLIERVGKRVFQSTPSTRRETLTILREKLLLIFQSTPSTRRETLFVS